MSLSWDTRNCKSALVEKGYIDSEGVWTEQGWNIHTCVTFACIGTGIGEIKENNTGEFWARYVIWTRACGSKPYFTYEDVRAYIGLKTNVFPELTRNQWLRQKIAYLVDDEFRKVINTPVLPKKKR